LLAVAPRWRVTHHVVTFAAGFYSLLYTLLLINAIQTTDAPDALEVMGSWEGVAKLLRTEVIVLPAWVHYIAFDLWTGRWIALDSSSRGVPQLLLIPILFATLMAGPVGLLAYLLLRGFWTEKKVKAE